MLFTEKTKIYDRAIRDKINYSKISKLLIVLDYNSLILPPFSIIDYNPIYVKDHEVC